jgi:regulatory protein
MIVTSIKIQINRSGRFSVFVDDSFSFSLSESALLETGIVKGQTLSEAELKNLKKMSADDILYNQALNYASLRRRSTWEMTGYLKRKDASPALIKTILNKLSYIGLLNDKKFAQAYIDDRKALRPTSRRKIIFDLRKKHVPKEVIATLAGENSGDDRSALLAIISRKRQQTRYQDDLKLMQYLVRQGFNYGDVKDALKDSG